MTLLSSELVWLFGPWFSSLASLYRAVLPDPGLVILYALAATTWGAGTLKGHKKFNRKTSSRDGLRTFAPNGWELYKNRMHYLNSRGRSGSYLFRYNTGTCLNKLNQLERRKSKSRMDTDVYGGGGPGRVVGMNISLPTPGS